MAVMIFSSIVGIGASFMSVFLVAMLRETRRVRTGLWGRLRQAFGDGSSQRQGRNSDLFELSVLPSKAVGHLVVMASRTETGSDTSRRVAGGGL